MLSGILLLVAAQQARVPVPLPPPPPPLGVADRLPASRVVETRYECAGERVTFTVRYDRAGRAEFVAGHRARGGLTSTVLHRVTQSLRQLDSVTSVTPVCAEEVHTLTAVGLVGGRRAEMMIVWTPFAVSAGPPEQRPGR